MSSEPNLNPYRGRLAPSPTGLLHLGHARTFWFAPERSRAPGATLRLRNHDLHAIRPRPASLEAAPRGAPLPAPFFAPYDRGAPLARLCLGGADDFPKCPPAALPRRARAAPRRETDFPVHPLAPPCDRSRSEE